MFKKYVPVLIIIISALSAGLIGKYLDSITGSTGAQTRGTLVFLFLPFVVTLLIRFIYKDSFKVKPVLSKSNSLIISIVWYVITIGLSLFIALSFGIYQLNLSSIDPAILVGLIITALIKNILEESVWRGYLTPKLSQLGVPNFYNHLIVGTTWALWHIPYLAVLNPQLTGDVLPYLPQFILSIIAVSWMYGELRLRTGSTFYPWLMHLVNNGITGVLVAFGWLTYQSGSKLFFSPFDGLVYTVITIGFSFISYYIFFYKNNN